MLACLEYDELRSAHIRCYKQHVYCYNKRNGHRCSTFPLFLDIFYLPSNLLGSVIASLVVWRTHAIYIFKPLIAVNDVSHGTQSTKTAVSRPDSPVLTASIIAKGQIETQSCDNREESNLEHGEWGIQYETCSSGKE